MLFTELEQRIIMNTVDIVFGPGSKSHLRNGLIADRLDKISLRDLKECTEDLASYCTAALLKMDESDSKYEALIAYNSIHAEILLKIEDALADPDLCDLDFFDHPLWDKM